ncbi:MAG: hypothetical protein V3T05_06425 [Myxococcota bacterium]
MVKQTVVRDILIDRVGRIPDRRPRPVEDALQLYLSLSVSS